MPVTLPREPEIVLQTQKRSFYAAPEGLEMCVQCGASVFRKTDLVNVVNGNPVVLFHELVCVSCGKKKQEWDGIPNLGGSVKSKIPKLNE